MQPRLEPVVADITTLDVDAVVNAANSALSGGGGVDGAIHRAAGHDALQDACRELGRCPPGEAVATPGFALRARWIIHTVGPVWHGGARDEPAVLASCYRRSLEVADALGAHSIAFPAISTGVFGYPGDLAAKVAIRTLASCQTETVDHVLLVAFDRPTYETYVSLLS